MPATPYMKLYVGDYLGDTQHLSCLEHGAYILLIMAYWQAGGPLKNDVTIIRRITKTSLKEYKNMYENVLKMFDLRDGMLVHNRIEKEIAKREQVSTAARDSANSRWCERNTDAMPTQYGRNATPIVHSPESIINTNTNTSPAKPSIRIVASATKAVALSETPGLYKTLWDSFLGQTKAFTNYGKEGHANKKLVELFKARLPDEPEKLAALVLERFKELTTNGDKFWRAQPFTPSALVSLLDRVMKDLENNRPWSAEDYEYDSEVPL